MTADNEENREPWKRLLAEVRSAHNSHPSLSAFCPFPSDLGPQPVVPFDIPAAQLLAQETGLFSEKLADLRDAFVTCGPLAKWRETYKETDIARDFMERFACYCLIGEGGPFISDKMSAWVVYMPPHLYYPWHHHPGEEMYLVVAGQAKFQRRGQPDQVLSPGQTCQHASNQPHAMETFDHPVMAYVIWRNGFDTPPVLTAD